MNSWNWKEKTKNLPHHSNLEAYSRDEVKNNERFDAERQRIFRSGLGVAFYITKDRPEVQQVPKILSIYMAGGTKLVFTVLRHLASYLNGAQEAGEPVSFEHKKTFTGAQEETDGFVPSRFSNRHGERNRGNREGFGQQITSEDFESPTSQ